MFTDRHETGQLEKPAAGGTENYSLTFVHAAQPETPKQTPSLMDIFLWKFWSCTYKLRVTSEAKFKKETDSIFCVFN
jgi:hypothetical protein